MASGFITLPDGTNWSARWSRYDWVLETVMNELSEDGDEGELKGWLKYILPDEENDYVESGYCFYKNDDSILRILDTRLMKDEYSGIFWGVVSDLNGKLDKGSDIGYLINELNECYQNSLRNSAKEPEDEDLSEIFFLGGFAIGKSGR